MNLIQYQALAIRTAKPAENKTFGYIHGALGVGSEVGELCEEFIRAMGAEHIDLLYVAKELGDHMWYLAYEAHENDIQLWSLVSDDAVQEAGASAPVFQDKETYGWDPKSVVYVLGLVAAQGEMLTQVKKHYIYGKPLDQLAMISSITMQINCIMKICNSLHISFTGLLQTNIDKLRLRFPDAYSDAAALARADESATA